MGMCICMFRDTPTHTKAFIRSKVRCKKWKNSNALKRNRENRKCKGSQRGTCGVCKDKRAAKKLVCMCVWGRKGWN